MLRTTHFYPVDSYPLDRRFIHWIGLIHWITYPPFVQPAPELQKYLAVYSIQLILQGDFATQVHVFA